MLCDCQFTLWLLCGYSVVLCLQSTVFTMILEIQTMFLTQFSYDQLIQTGFREIELVDEKPQACISLYGPCIQLVNSKHIACYLKIHTNFQTNATNI